MREGVSCLFVVGRAVRWIRRDQIRIRIPWSTKPTPEPFLDLQVSGFPQVVAYWEIKQGW
jgi:hypothetical protein